MTFLLFYGDTGVTITACVFFELIMAIVLVVFTSGYTALEKFNLTFITSTLVREG